MTKTEAQRLKDWPYIARLDLTCQEPAVKVTYTGKTLPFANKEDAQRFLHLRLRCLANQYDMCLSRENVVIKNAALRMEIEELMSVGAAAFSAAKEA